MNEIAPELVALPVRPVVLYAPVLASPASERDFCNFSGFRERASPSNTGETGYESRFGKYVEPYGRQSRRALPTTRTRETDGDRERLLY